VDTVAARDWVSRGQQKVLTAALLLAQAVLLDRRRGIRPVLLIDDLAAELGASYREAVMRTIARLRGQCFLTFLDASLIPGDLHDARMFHVEHGVVRPEG
jgi:DNA replication and repair protein RecF